MFALMRIGATACLLWLLAAAPAGAACIRFEETAVGDAYLINSCPMPMNVAYCVTGKHSALDCERGFNRIPVAAQSRKLLWSGTKPPVAGTCHINVLSCTAPSTLVYQAGNPPVCKVDSANAG